MFPLKEKEKKQGGGGSIRFSSHPLRKCCKSLSDGVCTIYYLFFFFYKVQPNKIGINILIFNKVYFKQMRCLALLGAQRTDGRNKTEQRFFRLLAIVIDKKKLCLQFFYACKKIIKFFFMLLPHEKQFLSQWKCNLTQHKFHGYIYIYILAIMSSISLNISICYSI